MTNARTKVRVYANEVSRPRATVSQGLAASFAYTPTLVRDALAQMLFQMAEPRRTVYYRNPDLKYKNSKMEK